MRHTENRFSEMDRFHMRDGIDQAVERLSKSTCRGEVRADPAVLQSAALHEIGCSSLDLRDSELREVQRVIREFMAGEVEPRNGTLVVLGR